MKTLVNKISVLALAALSATFATFIGFFALFGPCYDGCTTTSLFALMIEELPLSLINISLLLSAGLLYLLAILLCVSLFRTALRVTRWIYVLLAVAILPMLLLALYGLVFDPGDAVIYGSLVLMALGIVILMWFSTRRSGVKTEQQ